MGRTKARLEIDGEPLARRSARVLAAVCAPVLEVGPGYTDLPCVMEDTPGEGPLAAFVAGSTALPEGGPLLLVACDLPALDVAAVRLLADHPGAGTVIPEVAGRRQVLCARYGPDARAAAPGLLAAGERSLRALLDRTGYEVLGEGDWAPVVDAAAFGDLDTPEDLERFLARSRVAGGADR